MRKTLLTAAFLAALAAPAGAQVFDSQWLMTAPQARGLFGSAQFAGQARGGPSGPSYVTNLGVAEPFSRPGTVPVFSGLLGAGYVFPAGALPAWLGQMPRILFAGTLGAGSRISRLATTGLTAIGGVNGDGQLVNAGGGNFTYRQRQIHWGGQIAAASDFVLAPGLILTPGLRFFGSHTRQHIDSELGTVQLIDIENNERVTATRIGGGAGLGLTQHLGGGFAVHAGVNVALVHTQARLRASNGPLSVFAYSASRLGVEVGGQAGVSFAVSERMTIALVGHAAYLSQTPRVIAPNYNALIPVRLGFGDQIDAGGALRVSIGM